MRDTSAEENNRKYFGFRAHEIEIIGNEAIKNRDSKTLDLILEELKFRSVPKALSLAYQFREAADEIGIASKVKMPGKIISINLDDAADAKIVTDGEIVNLRRELIRSAKTSISITTYHISKQIDALFALLKKKADEGVKIKIVVSQKMAKNAKSMLAIEEIKHPNIEIRTPTNHSKLLVIDNEYCFFGSGNIDSSWRDFNIFLRSPKMALQLNKYIEELGK